MMEFMITTQEGTEKLTAKEAGQMIKALKASGFKLDPSFSRYHHYMANEDTRRASGWAFRYVTHCYFKRTAPFEVEAVNLTMSTADWFRDRH